MYIVTYCEDNRVHVPDVFDTLHEAWNYIAKRILTELKYSQVLTKEEAKEKLTEIVTSKEIKTKKRNTHRSASC